jgi:hypothetical protein
MIDLGMVFLALDYWVHWIGLESEFIEKTNKGHCTEGLHYYDGYNMTFWYALNHEWYKMNDKMYAKARSEFVYEPPNEVFDYPSSQYYIFRFVVMSVLYLVSSLSVTIVILALSNHARTC